MVDWRRTFRFMVFNETMGGVAPGDRMLRLDKRGRNDRYNEEAKWPSETRHGNPIFLEKLISDDQMRSGIGLASCGLIRRDPSRTYLKIVTGRGE